MKLWRVNTSLLAEEGMLDKIKLIWETQQQEQGRGGIPKPLRALEDTQVFLHRFGREQAKK